MTFNWLTRRHADGSNLSRRGGPARGTRLRLEPLEDRSVPATIFVTTTTDETTAGDGKLSLREAITRANADPGADTISVPAGVYKLTLGAAGEDDNAGGDLDVKGNVTIVGAGAGMTVVDGQRLDRVFDVLGTGVSSVKAVFQGLTIRNGSVTGDGGGILVGNADVVVRDSAVTGNRATLTGGGISNAVLAGTGDVRVVRSTVARNVADTDGGGLSVNGAGSDLSVIASSIRGNVAGGTFGGGISATTVTLTDSTVIGNTSFTHGGGIRADTATLTGCTVSGNSAGLDGGGIAALTPTLTDSIVSDNRAGRKGGGIHVTVQGTVTRGTVTNNSAQLGGGLYVEPTATATLTRSTVSNNRASNSGGGLLADTATLTRCTINSNFAANVGGGIYAGNFFAPSTGTVTLTDCTLSGNVAIADGGGLLVDGQGTAIVTGSTFSGNRAEDGGGVANHSVNLTTLTNCTVSGNTASHQGGGIFADAAYLLNCTVVENSAGSDGGGLYHVNVAGSTFSVRNTIVALNLAGATGPDVAGLIFVSLGHNLIGDATGGTGFTNGDNGNIVGDAANPIDPKLGPLANNGGPTKTHRLLASSPAIDAGDDTGVPTTDQRGLPRIKDGNFDGTAIVDIGAFER